VIKLAKLLMRIRGIMYLPLDCQLFQFVEYGGKGFMGYNPVDMGRRIAHVRKECGLSQYDLAEALYVSYSYISKIENGIRETSLAFMTAFSELTGTSLEYLIVGKKEAKDVKQLLEKVIATLCDLEKEL